MQTVLFASVRGAGSQMAAAFFDIFVHRSRARAIATVTQPAGPTCPEVAAVMREAGIDLLAHQPRLLTPTLAREVSLLVTMGCGDGLPAVPHLLREEWFLPDPDGKDVATVRSIRDDVRQRVRTLVHREGWADAEAGA